jgi:alpha-1,3-glucan synthase
MTNHTWLYSLAPTTNMHDSSHSDSEGPLQHDANRPPPTPMTGLQIFMSREIGGWPIYTIVIAIGQVCSDTFIVKKD